METEEATNPVAEEAHASDATGVADEANAQGDDLNLDTGTGDADNLDEDGNPIEAEAEADDLEEIELDGKTFKVPKDIKFAVMKDADYRQKTTAVAEQRRDVETQRQALDQERTQQAELVKTLRADIGKVERLSADIEQYKDVDWRAAQMQIAQLTADPNRQAEALQAQAQYNLAWQQFTAIERDLAQAKTQLTEKETRFAAEQTQKVQAQQREAFATLERDIPGFNAAVLNAVADHGMKGYGLTPEEARQIADPRVWKLLHADHAKAAEIAKLKTENAKLKGQRTAQANNEAAQQVKPAAAVRGSAPASPAPRDDMPMDQWVRAEKARMAKARR